MLSGADLAQVERTATTAVVDAKRLGALPVVAAARGLAAMAASFREDLPVARQLFAECLVDLSLVDGTAAPFFPATTVCTMLVPVGDAMLPTFEETWLLGRRGGALQAQGYALAGLANVHRFAGDLDSALEAVHRSVDVFAQIADPAGLALALNQLGCVERDRRLFDLAESHLREALRIRGQHGDRRGENMSAANLGLLSAAAGDIENGRRLARLALDRGEAVEDGPGVGGALLNLAVVELFGGEPRVARVYVEQAVAALRPQGYLRLEAWACLLAAELALDDDDDEACVRYGRAAADLFAQVGCRIGLPRAAALRSVKGIPQGSRSSRPKAR
jgi:tetratricopeptide (TPR) repeat protein